MFGFIEKIKESIVSKYLGSIVRHGLSSIAGLMLASTLPGMADLGAVLQANIGQLEAAITGLGLFAGSLVWSLINKKKSE